MMWPWLKFLIVRICVVGKPLGVVVIERKVMRLTLELFRNMRVHIAIEPTSSFLGKGNVAGI